MVVGVSERLNSDGDLVRAMLSLRDACSNAFGTVPAVLLENRTEQFIRDGTSIAGFWSSLLSAAPGLEEDSGIVLDVQQLFTLTGTRLLENLAIIPPDSTRAFHIHTKHGTPTPADLIPWPESSRSFEGSIATCRSTPRCTISRMRLQR